MQNIGERLEEARKRKGISIREAAEATKVRGDYLHKFESNQFDINLPEIYVRGFLRTYANYLKLPSDKIIADYKALGLANAEGKTRSLNREVYGRMDLSVSSKEAAREPEVTTAAGTAPVEPAENRPARTDSNPATFVPKGRALYLDKGLMMKAGVAAAGAIILIVLIVWVVNALSSSDGPGSASAPPSAQPEEKRIVLIALDTVAVTLVQASDNAVLFEGTLVRNESRSFPKRGDLFLTASALENVEIEMNGQRFPTNMRGRGRVRIQ